MIGMAVVVGVVGNVVVVVAGVVCVLMRGVGVGG